MTMDKKRIEDEEAFFRNITRQYYSEPTWKEIENYKKLNIDRKKSYLIMCNHKTFKKFMFLYTMSFEREFTTYDASVYLNYARDHSIDVDSKDLFIVEYNKNFEGYGDTGYLTLSKISEAATLRSRRGNTTIILAEKLPSAQDKEKRKTCNLVECLKDDFSILHLNEELLEKNTASKSCNSSDLGLEGLR
jgi:phosphoserine aminotransferase